VKHARPVRFTSSRGFTLVESLIVLVVMSIAAITIAALQGNIFKGQTDNKDFEVGVQLIQGCAEQVLGVRLINGYDAVSSCSNIKIDSYGAPTPNVIKNTANGDTIAGCPTGGTCRLISIQESNSRAVILLLVKY